jgi:hypothetical protein
MSGEDREKLQDANVKIRSNSKYKGTYEDARKISEDDLETVFETLEGKGDIYIERKLIKSDIEDLDPFHWMFEFPSTFAPNKDQRFDVVIGNPPHGSDLGDIEKPILEDFYDLIEKKREVAKMFTERSWKLTEGELSFIIPKASTYNSTWEDFRKFSVQKLKRSLDLGKAFDNVDHEQVTVHLSRSGEGITSYQCGRLEQEDYFLSETNSSQMEKKFAERLGTIPSNLSPEEQKLATTLESSSFPRIRDYDTKIGRGAGRRYKTDNENSPKALQGKEVQRFYIREIKDKVQKSNVSESCKSRINEPKVVAQNIVAHIQNPYDRIKVTALYDPDKTYNFETVSNIVLEDDELPSEETFTLLLNSSFLNWYIYMLIYNRAIRDMHFDKYFIKRVILPERIDTAEEDLMQKLHDIIAVLSNKEEYSNKKREVENLVNGIVYEIYLRDIEDGLNTELSQVISEKLDLEDLDYEEWFKKSKKEEIDNDLLEEAADQADEVIEELSDTEVESEMEEIAKNKWVQIIERTSDSEEVTIDFGAR